jgi:twitching motility protein PilU
VTIEDPIEFVHEHRNCIVTQREVGVDTDNWEIALKNSLRAAPDVILIGEIRDRHTMDYAVAFAETGHLCLATLHANNAYQAMNRVISFFPLEVRPMLLQDLSVCLKAVISQRLVKTVDGKRVPAVEVLLNTRNIQELIEKGEITEIKEAMEKSMSPGSQTFEQDLFRLVRQGKISTDEALANADSATNLGLLLGNSGIMPAMAERAKQPSSPSRPGAPSFGEFKITEESEERL